MLDISTIYTCAIKNTIIWGMVSDIWSETEFFCHFGPFFTYFPFNNSEINILKKWKKHLEMSSCYTCVPKISTTWCMLPKIWSATENFLSFWVIFCPFTPLITPKIKIWKNCTNCLEILSFSHVNHKWMLYDVWFLRYKASQRELLVILGQFFIFDSPNNLKNEKCEKMKKSHGNIIIIHLCNINYNHIYDVWFLRYGVGCTELFVILGHFSPSAPLKTYKIKTLIEWKKKDLEISSEFFCQFGLVYALYQNWKK